MIVDYKDYTLDVNILIYDEDDLEWELVGDDDHTSVLDQILHEDSYLDDINELIISAVAYEAEEAKMERQLSDLEYW